MMHSLTPAWRTLQSTDLPVRKKAGLIALEGAFKDLHPHISENCIIVRLPSGPTLFG
jgi:hypothetical protein